MKTNQNLYVIFNHFLCSLLIPVLLTTSFTLEAGKKSRNKCKAKGIEW